MGTKSNIIKVVLAHDKLKHFFLGFFIFEFASTFTCLLNSLIVTLSVACLWELGQVATKKGKGELLDIFYTVLPALLIYLKYILQNGTI